jgi:hypothetical protein
VALHHHAFFQGHKRAASITFKKTKYKPDTNTVPAIPSTAAKASLAVKYVYLLFLDFLIVK